MNCNFLQHDVYRGAVSAIHRNPLDLLEVLQATNHMPEYGVLAIQRHVRGIGDKELASCTCIPVLARAVEIRCDNTDKPSCAPCITS